MAIKKSQPVSSQVKEPLVDVNGRVTLSWLKWFQQIPTQLENLEGSFTLPITTADVTGLLSALAAREQTAHKGAASGYAGLDETGKVPTAQLPTLAAVATSGSYADLTDTPTLGGVLRLVGVTIDGGGEGITTGVKGCIQVPFAGTIVGWSIEADQSGSISIQVEKHAGTETAPVVPTADTDKISASAPMVISSAQIAGAGASGVSTWTTAVAAWDSIQFNVTAASTVTRVTAYLKIQQGDAATAGTLANPEVPSGTINGTDGTDGNATFTLTHTPSQPAALDLYVNGIRMTQGLAYTLSGNTITYKSGYIPIAGEEGDTHETGAYRY